MSNKNRCLILNHSLSDCTNSFAFYIIAEDNMNIQLRDITVTARDGRVSQLDQVYIRGSHVRFFIVPDMLKNAPMFKGAGPGGLKGRGIGLGRGRATVARAQQGKEREIK